MNNILSHVKWFNNPTPGHIEALGWLEWFAVFTIVIAGLFVFRFIGIWLAQHKYTAKCDKKLSFLRPWVPLVVRLSTAALLLVNVTQGYLLAPNVLTNDSTISVAISVLFITASISLLFGVFNKAGVVALLAGYLLVLSQTDFVNVMDHFEYIAIGGYLWLRGPGKYSVDNYLAGGKLSMPSSRKYSLPVYRIGAGITLVTLALSEKLLNLTIAQDFLNLHSWNLMAFAGISDRYFILIAGAVELLVGIALILNYAPRLLVTVVLGLMAITAVLLGIEEIYGHLFAVGLVAAIWVNDTKPSKHD